VALAAASEGQKADADAALAAAAQRDPAAFGPLYLRYDAALGRPARARRVGTSRLYVRERSQVVAYDLKVALQPSTGTDPVPCEPQRASAGGVNAGTNLDDPAYPDGP
jgi:hypothetical protein